MSSRESRGAQSASSRHRVLSRILLPVMVLALLLSACGGKDNDTSGKVDAEQKVETLRFRHPATIAFAAPFQMMQSDEALKKYANTIDDGEWTTPDVLRSMLVNGQTDVTAVPTYVGANLANKGVDVKMAAVVVWGLLWMIGPEDAAPGWDSLRGQTIMIPYRNDMPDLVFRHLAEVNGLTPGTDFTIEYYAKPPDVVSRLVSGKGTWAILPEHTATLALNNAKQNGQSLGRFFDLQKEWGAATGGKARIPQAGIVVSSALAEKQPELLGAILDSLTRAVETVNKAEPATVTQLAEASGLPEPVVKDVIPRLNLEVVPAADAREELETFYNELAKLSPDIIGGKLPDASFYLADPRK